MALSRLHARSDSYSYSAAYSAIARPKTDTGKPEIQPVSKPENLHRCVLS